MNSDCDESIEDFKKPKKRMKKNSKQVKKVDLETSTGNLDTVNPKKEGVKRKKVVKVSKTKMESKSTEADGNLQASQDKAHCPTCGELFDVLILREHTTACLRVNFESCKRKVDASDIGHQNDSLSGNNEPFLCPNCEQDLSLLSTYQRNRHINRCIDNVIVPQDAPSGKVKNKSSEQTHCPLCLKVCTSKRSYKRHLKLCQQKNTFSTMTALEVHRPSNDESVGDEILEGIRRIENRPFQSETVVKVKPKKTKKKVIRKPKPKINPEDEMLQLAIAVSKNEDLHKARSKKKKQEVSIIPVMITVSPNTKRQQLQTRLRSIAHQEDVSDDDDVPSTPALPATTLHVRPRLRNRDFLNEQAYYDDDAQPGPSGLNRQTRQENNEGSASGSVSNTQASRPDEPSVTSSAPVAPQKSHNDELQSPEVSSSDMNNILINEAGDSPPMPHSTGVDDAPVPREKVSSHNSRWNIASASTLNRSSYHVRGLLSQFTKPETSPAPVVSMEEPTALNTSTDINSTLQALEALVNTQFSPPPSVHNSSSLNMDIGAGLSKLIDNPLFSDCKIMTGDSAEVNLHQNILYCLCPAMFNEFAISGEKIPVLHLPEYSKQDVMPVIEYIYSSSETLLNLITEKGEEVGSKTQKLMERFNITAEDVKEKSQSIIEDLNILDLTQNAPEELPPENKPEKNEEDQVVGVKNENLSVMSDDAVFTQEPSVEDLHDDDEDLPANELTQGDPVERNENDFNNMLLENEDSFSAVLLNNQPSPALSLENQSRECSEIPSDCDLFGFNIEEGTADVKNISDVTNEKMNISGIDSQNDTSENNASLQDNSIGESGPEDGTDLKSLTLALVSKDKTDSCDDETGVSMIESSLFCVSEPSTPVDEPSEVSFSSSLPTRPKRRKIDRYSVRRSRRRSNSLKRHSGWRHANCPCCSDKDSPNSPLRKRSSIGKRYEATPKRPQLQRRPKQPVKKLKRKNVPTISVESMVIKLRKRTRAQTSRSQNQLQLSKHKNSTPVRSTSLLKFEPVEDIKIPSKVTPTSRPDSQNQLQSSKHKNSTPVRSTSLLKFEPVEDIKIPSKVTPTSPPDSTPAATPSSKSKLSKDMVYISERLPRLKEREHIRRRPGVAMMGKRSNKGPKAPKRSPGTTKSKNIEEKQKKSAENLSSSQPVMSDAIEKVEEPASQKKRKSKKLVLSGYASSSGTSGKVHRDALLSSDSEISIYDSDTDSATSYQQQGIVSTQMELGYKTPLAIVTKSNSMAQTPNTATLHPYDAENALGSDDAGPVPITPMLDFCSMETPEVFKRATKIGLKKSLGKEKLKTKLTEEYLYKHQIASESDDSFDEGQERSQEDDLCRSTKQSEVGKMKLNLSRLSASPNIQHDPKTFYSFSTLSSEEVEKLATSVVEAMHNDGTLREALDNMKQETGSILRGSRQDRQRCWDIITPGSSLYNPKFNAILCLSEDHQTAITTPVIGCVVKHYIEYKKYQFDCLPVVCDRMESEFIKKYDPS